MYFLCLKYLNFLARHHFFIMDDAGLPLSKSLFCVGAPTNNLRVRLCHPPSLSSERLDGGCCSSLRPKQCCLPHVYTTTVSSCFSLNPMCCWCCISCLLCRVVRLFVVCSGVPDKTCRGPVVLPSTMSSISSSATAVFDPRKNCDHCVLSKVRTRGSGRGVNEDGACLLLDFLLF